MPLEAKYNVDIWKKCSGSSQISLLNIAAFRVVESQEHVATMKLVDSFEEQEILESLIENTKPPVNYNGRHYLIMTPFRYPPLRYGSRFGEKIYGGIFYGSKTLQTCFSECAYYRFLFIDGMETMPKSNKIQTQHTTFNATIHTSKGILLNSEPFCKYNELISPSDYTTTQQLGTKMRNDGIEAFTFTSARDIEKGINVAVLNPDAIASNEPYNLQQWSCTSTNNSVNFHDPIMKKVYKYKIDQFLKDGQLPSPAA